MMDWVVSKLNDAFFTMVWHWVLSFLHALVIVGGSVGLLALVMVWGFWPLNDDQKQAPFCALYYWVKRKIGRDDEA